jgi:hypothetical protein
MSRPHDNPEPMSRADIVTLESALRKGWPMPDERLREQISRVQAVLDDPRSNDRARWRAKRILELARSRFIGQETVESPWSSRRRGSQKADEKISGSSGQTSQRIDR